MPVSLPLSVLTALANIPVGADMYMDSPSRCRGQPSKDQKFSLSSRIIPVRLRPLPLGSPSTLITAAVPGARIAGVGPGWLSLRYCFGVGTYTVQYISTLRDCWKAPCKEAGLVAQMWGRHRDSSHGDRQAHGSGSHTCEGFKYRFSQS